MVEVARPSETIFELRFASREELAREYDENLRNLGAFLPTEQPLPLHTPIQLHLILPGRETPIELKGTVVHVATPEQPLPGLPPGMAIQLQPLGPEISEALAPAPAGGEGEAAEAPAAEEPATPEGKGGEGITIGDSANLFQSVRSASLPEKIKLAKQGTKAVLNVLIQEGDKQIMRFVLQNPRLGAAEISQILKNPTVTMETIQTIAKNATWMQNDQIRNMVVLNPKTPMPLALQLLPGLNLKDLSKIAKSSNVKAQLKSKALKLLMERRSSS